MAAEPKDTLRDVRIVSMANALQALLDLSDAQGRDVLLALERVAAEARAEEREACAKLAEQESGRYQIGRNSVPYWDGGKSAALIRARGGRDDGE